MAATWIVTALLVVMGVGLPFVLPEKAGPARWLVPVFTLPSLFISALFLIRGYEVVGGTLGIRRLFWTTRIPLHDLQSAEVDPEAMKRSIRLFGNGGLFVFAGTFRNRKLGTYRAFVTDPKRAVVLIFPNRKIVITPESPRRFAELVDPAHS